APTSRPSSKPTSKPRRRPSAPLRQTATSKRLPAHRGDAEDAEVWFSKKNLRALRASAVRLKPFIWSASGILSDAETSQGRAPDRGRGQRLWPARGRPR